MANPLGRMTRPYVRHRGGPLFRIKLADLEAANVERVTLRTIGAQAGKPVLEDGRVLDVTNVIWCTGFRGDYGWIDGDRAGTPRALFRRSQVPAVHRLDAHRWGRQGCGLYRRSHCCRTTRTRCWRGLGSACSFSDGLSRTWSRDAAPAPRGCRRTYHNVRISI
jgi:hypothetical protein